MYTGFTSDASCACHSAISNTRLHTATKTKKKRGTEIIIAQLARNYDDQPGSQGQRYITLFYYISICFYYRKLFLSLRKIPTKSHLSSARCRDSRRNHADSVIKAAMMGGENTLGHSAQFIYTMRQTRARRSYTGYYPSLPS